MGRGQMTRQLREEAGCRGRAPGAPSPRTVTCRRGHGGEAWFGATGVGDLGTAEAGAVWGGPERSQVCAPHAHEEGVRCRHRSRRQKVGTTQMASGGERTDNVTRGTRISSQAAQSGWRGQTASRGARCVRCFHGDTCSTVSPYGPEGRAWRAGAEGRPVASAQ